MKFILGMEIPWGVGISDILCYYGDTVTMEKKETLNKFCCLKAYEVHIRYGSSLWQSGFATYLIARVMLLPWQQETE